MSNYETIVSEQVFSDHGFGWDVRPDGERIGVRLRYLETDGSEMEVDAIIDDAVPFVICSMARVAWAVYPKTRESLLCELSRLVESLKAQTSST